MIRTGRTDLDAVMKSSADPCHRTALSYKQHMTKADRTTLQVIARKSLQTIAYRTSVASG
jgi:hypothetical protein